MTIGARGRQRGDKPECRQGQGQPHSSTLGSPSLSPNSTLFPPGCWRQNLPPAPRPLQSPCGRVARWDPALPPLAFRPVPQARSPWHSDLGNGWTGAD